MKASCSNKCHTKYITFWSSNKHQLNSKLPVEQVHLSWMLEPCTGYILNINMQYLRKRDNPNSLFWCVYLLSPKIVSIFIGRSHSEGEKRATFTLSLVLVALRTHVYYCRLKSQERNLKCGQFQSFVASL